LWANDQQGSPPNRDPDDSPTTELLRDYLAADPRLDDPLALLFCARTQTTGALRRRVSTRRWKNPASRSRFSISIAARADVSIVAPDSVAV
jgi:hypothetical protein